LVGDLVPHILYDGEGNFIPSGVSGHTLEAILRVGVNAYKRDAFTSILFVQLGENGKELIAERTFDAEKYEDDGLVFLAQAGQSDATAITRIFETKIDCSANLFRRFFCFGAEANAQQREGDKK